MGDESDLRRERDHLAARVVELEGRLGQLEAGTNAMQETASDALHQSERFLSDVFASIQDGISVLDSELRILRTNPAMERWYAHAMPLTGKRCHEAYHGTDRPCQVCPTRQTMATGQSTMETVPRRGAGGAITGWLDLYAFPLVDQRTGAAQGVIEYVRDVTEQTQLRQQLQQSQRLEAIGRLAAGVAHDFNNLLTPIIGFADMALIDMQAQDRWYDEMQQIFDAANHAQALTQQLLAFGRRQVLKVVAVDLGQVVLDAEKILRRLLQENIELQMVCAPSRLVLGDRSQLNQILFNLALNGAESMPDGGRLTIEVKEVELGQADCERRELESGRYTVLRVTDTGHGMDPATAACIFEPFFTTKDPGGGTGLGLAVVHGIVKQHGGQILVHSEPGQGTTFEVYLKQSTTAREHITRPAVGTTAGNGERVLVVEDSEPVLRLATTVLRRHGYHVLSAQNAEQALERVERELDLLLTDVILPGLNGRQLFDRLKQRDPRLRVLYMSGYPDDVIARQGVLDEGIHLLQKPFSVQQLLQMVRRALES